MKNTNWTHEDLDRKAWNIQKLNIDKQYHTTFLSRHLSAKLNFVLSRVTINTDRKLFYSVTKYLNVELDTWVDLRCSSLSCCYTKSPPVSWFFLFRSRLLMPSSGCQTYSLERLEIGPYHYLYPLSFFKHYYLLYTLYIVFWKLCPIKYPCAIQ